MATTSRAGVAQDALVALATAQLPGVDVVDGPPLTWDQIKLATDQLGDGTRYLFIGAQPQSATWLQGQQDFNAAGAVSRDEHFEIICTALGYSGDGVAKTARDAALAVMAGLEQVIRADPSLGGVVLYSRVSTVDRGDITLNTSGVNVPIIFRVACRAYLS
jgi:hypothetical protein